MKEFKICAIELYNFVGFQVPRIKLFKATFESVLTMIISTNGSGKSAMISELNIFPIDKDLFYTEGYKSIIFIFNGKNYKLVSNHSKHFLFDLDEDVNLNPGGTASAYIELIKNLFGITRYQWDIATGSLNFVKADGNTRRRFIEEISGVDFTFPFKVYKQITGSISSTTKMIKKLEVDLGIERHNSLSEDTVLEYVEKQKYLSGKVREILNSSTGKYTLLDADRLEAVMSRHEIDVSETFKRFNALEDLINTTPEYDTIEKLTQRREEIKQSKVLLEVQYENIIKEISEKSKLVETIYTHQMMSVESLEANLDEIDLGIQRTKERLLALNTGVIEDQLFDVSESQGESLVERIGVVSTSFADTLLLTYDLSENDFVIKETKDEISKYNMDYTDTTLEYRSLNYAISEHKKHIETIEHSDDIECENCNTTFKIGSNKINGVKQTLALKESRLEELKQKGIVLREVLDNIEKTKKNRELVLGLLQTLPEWFKVVISEELERNISLTGIIAFLTELEEITKLSVSIKLMHTQKSKLNGLLEECKRLQSLDKDGHLKNRLVEGEKELQDLQVEREGIINTLHDVENTIRLYNLHTDTLDGLANSLNTLEETRKDYLAILKDATLTLVGDELQVKLAKIVKSLNEVEINKALVDKIENMVAVSKAELGVYKDLEKTLNPKTGLIAKRLIGYCNYFTLHTNSIISKIWGYPMSIETCSIKGKANDSYKFPIRTGDNEVATKDISKGSKSMRNVINLAIMLVARKSLSLDGLPLNLDEIGGGFDQLHNVKLIEFVRNLVDNAESSNVFMVHHDVGVRGGLGVYDSVVLDNTQVLVDPGYNKNVYIEYYED